MHPVFVPSEVSEVSPERGEELTLRSLVGVGSAALVARFAGKPEELAYVFAQSIVLSAEGDGRFLPYVERLRQVARWWGDSSRRYGESGIENAPDFVPHFIFSFGDREKIDDRGYRTIALVQTLLHGGPPIGIFREGRELLIKVLLIRAHQCGVL